MHLMYISMSRKEQRSGLCLLIMMLVTVLVFPLRPSVSAEFAFWGICFAGALFIFRRFLIASAQIPLTPAFTVLKFSLLGYILAFLANLLTNDLIFYFLPRHFYYNETGPHFLNICKEQLAGFASENFLLATGFTILFVPVVEELLYRGLLFGTLVRKNLPLAYLVSTIVYSMILIVPVWESASMDYLLLCFIQYLPVNLMFCWIYTRTETILTPILAHIIMNAVSILTLR